jgi:hypothetical protein
MLWNNDKEWKKKSVRSWWVFIAVTLPRFVFGRCSVLASIEIPFILAEVYHSFPQSLQLIVEIRHRFATGAAFQILSNSSVTLPHNTIKNVKLSLCLIHSAPHHLGVCGEWSYSSYILALDTRSRWVASFTSRPLCFRERFLGTR